MRVFIADKFEQSGRDQLAAIGCEVIYQPGTKDEALVQAVAQSAPDVLVVRSTRVTDKMLGAGTLKLVVRAGAGYNTIDVAAASRRGIYVSNCPGKNSIAVAELAFALILALDRRLADNVISLRRGEWNKELYSKARGLFGRTLGLVGLGRIGAEMLPRARGFGLPVAAWSRSLTPERAEGLGIKFKGSPEEVAASADAATSSGLPLNLIPRPSARSGVRLRLHAATGRPKPRARGSISAPIRPSPTKPSVRPNNPRALEYSSLFHSPRRRLITLSARRRSSARIRAKASSATAMEFLPGQFET